ncbi:MAG: Atu4866 domain-containing protein [Chitinophagaceae bacterium]|nr:Atu4866 domain-containing protein [Rubrivivax sp.]
MHHIPVHPSRRALVTLIAVAVLLGMTSLAGTATEARNAMRLIPPRTTPATPPTPQSHPYLGMWVTEDGHIRHELLPSGRYDEQRGDRKSAYVGKYWIQGDRIEYLDDTGFTADGEFRDGVFHHGGYVFRREPR